MKTKNKGNKPEQRLQKVSNSNQPKLVGNTINSIEETFNREKITPQDLPSDPAKRKLLLDTIQDHIYTLKGSDLDHYLDKIESLMSPDSDLKNQTWERAHIAITVWMGKLMKEYNRVPSITEIAQETNYSRKTIHAHLKEFESSPFFQEERQKFKILNSTILSRLYDLAFHGDVKACRLFLEFTGGIKSKEIINYIQINSLVVTEETIKQLPQVKQIEIENFIKKAISEVN